METIFWVHSDNIRIGGETKLRGEKVHLKMTPHIHSLIESGVLSTSPPFNEISVKEEESTQEEEVSSLDVPTKQTPPQPKPLKRKRKKHARRPTEGVSQLRDTFEEVPKGLSGTQSPD